MKNIDLFGGGTVSHITSHFSICAPAYGTTARYLEQLIKRDKRFDHFCLNSPILTRMAGGQLETNEDVAAKVEELKADPNTKIVFFNCALVDWEPQELSLFGRETYVANKYLRGDSMGKYATRLETRNCEYLDLTLTPSAKIISSIKTGRPDIFLIGFKTTCGEDVTSMTAKGVRLCKESNVDLVFVNDVKTRRNVIVDVNGSIFSYSLDRNEALRELVNLTYARTIGT